MNVLLYTTGGLTVADKTTGALRTDLTRQL